MKPANDDRNSEVCCAPLMSCGERNRAGALPRSVVRWPSVGGGCASRTGGGASAVGVTVPGVV
eukprot:12504530-Alexandrium_andersonii.AAC.1